MWNPWNYGYTGLETTTETSGTTTSSGCTRNHPRRASLRLIRAESRFSLRAALVCACQCMPKYLRVRACRHTCMSVSVRLDVRVVSVHVWSRVFVVHVVILACQCVSGSTCVSCRCVFGPVFSWCMWSRAKIMWHYCIAFPAVSETLRSAC